MPFLSLLCRSLLVFLSLALPLSAAELPAPAGPPLLTVTGQITRTNDGDSARFDRAMLEAMTQTSFTTRTIWTDGEQRFTGVALHDLLAALGATGSTIRATAINDYAVDIPREDWETGAPIIAHSNNGRPMSLRDKGPLWIIYPYDSDRAYQSEQVYARSIWQLDRINVME
ncbi:oxidoreductase [Salipiger abyssi]|uniref:oxidoreductase n=1 Tax=Salipiger abyssi TaxID=1250539 RepID=UPI001A8DDACF|nr:oxidoreductase [Salipiger abyssi]MBN9886945.1 oxidoreductase [Salipiger abyssi]